MEDQTTQHQHQQYHRRQLKDVSYRRVPRASNTCIRCNNRNVRCDILRTTSASTSTAISRCTNCRLDDQPCILRPRKRRRGPSCPDDARVSVADSGTEPLHISNSATGPVHNYTGASSLLPEALPIQELYPMSYLGETELSPRTKLRTNPAICSTTGTSVLL